MPSKAAKTAPETKMLTAAISAQKKRSLPYPNGCRRSGLRSERLSAVSSSTSVAVSATLCAASAYMAAEPVKIPATSFNTPIPALAPIATSTVSVLSPPPFASFSSATPEG